MTNSDGMGKNARFDSPQALVIDAAGNVFVADTGNYTIRKITPAGREWSGRHFPVFG